MLTNNNQLFLPQKYGWSLIKGAVIKYEADRGGMECTGPPNILREECWANRIFPTEKMDHRILIKNDSKNFQEVSLLSRYYNSHSH